VLAVSLRHLSGNDDEQESLGCKPSRVQSATQETREKDHMTGNAIRNNFGQLSDRSRDTRRVTFLTSRGRVRVQIQI
jgi:hypothetical protein